MVSRSSRNEFRTSVILTETPFKRVRKTARVNDASIAWVVRQAVNCYLETQGTPSAERRGGRKPKER